ncbi:Transcription factor fungi [Macrophomina phaseolina MS6]|uniref:Transcription factor fungi n=1 Tax=Macrophomina phaseolina (strain MS6) TaxID=1126212 RepID=K2RN01_MACPH|nr:Transcription factor fungi [Macrophomina phaseolina MS6]
MTPREDHVNFPLLLISIVAALLALMTTFLTARFYARCSVDIWLGIQYGVGQHYWNFEWNPFLGKSFFAYTLCWYVGTGLTKISVRLGYLRLFPGRANQWFCHATIAFSACLALGASIIAVFRCQPISDAWAKKSTHCAPYLPVQPIISASGAAINATIFLWSLYLVPRPRRLELVILFGVGCCITFITAFRIACDVTNLFDADQRDFFRDYAWFYMLQTFELDLRVVGREEDAEAVD